VRVLFSPMHISIRLSSHLECQSALVPICIFRHIPLDDAALSDNEAQWGSSIVAGIELAAIGLECAAVMDGDLVALLGLALAFDCAGDIDLDFVSSNEGHC
jgi:hypothetical protein